MLSEHILEDYCVVAFPYVDKVVSKDIRLAASLVEAI
ncbi:unannotated protein [freshwater metagenome]|uniref:Unannotated protein n=1 Tax=freshwater metagenome TaxID=449393 RepID=A0A6J6UR06_9ZZZZ